MRRVRVPLVPRWLRRTIVVAIAATVFAASVVIVPEDAPGGPLGPWRDELLHVLAYATLALALAYATAERANGSVRRVAAVVALAVGYGVLIELLQAPVPYRQFSTGDMGANAAGALVGSTWIACERRIRYRSLDADDG